MVLDSEQRAQPLLLPVGEQVVAGVQGAARAVEGVVLAAAVPVQVLLDTASAAVRRVAGETDDVEGVMATSS